MNRKMKLRYRAALSLILSAVLFCMPAAAFSMNGDNAIDARAEDSVESGTEEDVPGGTVSGNDVPEPVCACEKKCGAYDFDKDCEVCAADYKDCEYKTPNVVIHINCCFSD